MRSSAPGNPSTDVITVQGASGMTPVKVDGSGVTQPVSGTVTADTELPAATALADFEADGQITSRIGVVLYARNAGGPSMSRLQTPTFGDGASGGLILATGQCLWNGGAVATGYDKQKDASATNVSGTSGTGAALIAPVGNWSVVHSPVANTKATATKAAGGAGVRHVCTGISAALASTGANTAVNVSINLIDGASGGATFLFQKTVTLPATGAVVGVDLSGLSLFGSAATAMTLEFSAAGGASTIESVTLMGYDVS